MTKNYILILLCSFCHYWAVGQVYPKISISADKLEIKSGEIINFIATYSGGGPSPKFEWKKNGQTVGANSSNFSDLTLKDGDKIACVLTSNDSLRSMNIVSSNFISPIVNTPVILPELKGDGVVGSRISLTSSPTEKVVWKKDGVILNNPLNGNLGSGKMVAGNFETKVSISSPGKIFIDKSGKLYVCESTKNRILRFDSENSDPIIVAGGNGKGLGPNQLYEPSDVFVDENSILYIADGSRIIKWLPGSITGVTILSLNSSSNSIFLDDLGFIYFNDYFNHKVFKCKKDGSNITQVAGGASSAIGNSGSSPDLLKYPTGLFVDKNFDLYIADTENHRIQKWKPGATSGITVAGGNGNAYSLNPGTNISNPNQLSFPNDVYVDKNLNIYISAGNDARIQKWELNSTTGITVAGGNGQGSSSNQFSTTSSVFLNESGNIIVSDSWNKRIQKWKEGSTIGETIAGSRFTVNSISLSNPTAIQIDKKNNDLYVADWGTIQITKWPESSLNGIILASNVGFNTGMSNPTGLILSPDGTMYITQRVANNVLKWSPGAGKGIIVAGGTASGNSDKLLNAPVSSFLDKNGNLYVVDSGNHRIQKWKQGATSGITVAGGNGSGNQNNQLNYPSSIYVDSVGKMYIADKSNSRIVIWKEGESSSIKSVNISYPNGIKVDSYGNFYTISAAEVVKYDKDLNNPTVIVGGKDLGNTSNIFSDPQDVEIDKFGNIYVSDYGNGRVQKFILENSQSFIPNLPGNYTATITTKYGEFVSNIYKVLLQDTDKDGVEDAEDKCLNTPIGEPVDQFGCSLSQKDSDKDGINDKIDKCPDTKIGVKVDIDGCADYQKDTDKDGITDDLDLCPNTPNSEQIDSNGCSLSQKDTDKDGINDKIDKCPNTLSGSKVDSNGCADYQKDTDNDGINDALDKCPDTPAGIKVDAKGCSDAQNTCNSIKPNLNINSNFEISTTTLGLNFTWFLDDQFLFEGKSQNYIPVRSGKYSIKVLVSDKCLSAISDYVTVLITGNELDSRYINAYPNPFNKEIKIQIPVEFGVDANIKIFDLKGSLVFSKNSVVNDEILYLNFLSSGTYFMNVESINNKLKSTIKLLKN